MSLPKPFEPVVSLPSLAPPAPKPGRKRWLWAGLGIAVLLVLGLGVWLVVRARPQPAAPVSSDVPKQDGQLLRLSPAYAQRIGLKTAPATVQLLTPRLHLTGEMTYDPRLTAAIGARIAGRVRVLHHVVGDEVKKGEVLAEIESAELGRAQADALKAKAREQAARAEAERERRLADAKVSAEREAELALASLEAVKAERIAAERAVQALGGDFRGELGVVYLSSPLKGRVMEMNVSQGQTVEDSHTAVRVADLSRLRVELTLYERDLNAVRVGDPVEVHIQGRALFPHGIRGVVSHIGDEVDPEHHSAKLRVEVDNRKGELRPGMAVNATVEASGPAAEYLTIPPSAVTRIDGKPTVFVAVEPLAVEARTVELGPEGEDRVAVVKGLKEKEEVVTVGVFALKSESFR